MSYTSYGNGPALVASSVVSLVLTLGFSSARVYVRWFLLRLWKVEDWLFVGSQICFVLLALVGLLSAVYGNGQKLAFISQEDVPIAMQYWFAAELLYSITTILIRLSIGFFLLRICILKTHIWIIRIAMVLISFITLIYIIFVIGQCHPISYFWLRFSGAEGICVSPQFFKDISITFSVSSAMTDLVFGILPLFVIWNLQMNPRAKAILGFLLTLGILAALSVIVRVYYVQKVQPSAEFLYTTSNVSIWSMVEPAIGICCMAASTFKPLFKSLLEERNPTPAINTHNHTNVTHSPNLRSYHTKKVSSSSGMGIFLQKSKFGSMKSNYSKNSNPDSFNFKMGMDFYETRAEGPGRSDVGGERVGEGWGLKGGIIHTTTVEVRTSERVETEEDYV